MISIKAVVQSGDLSATHRPRSLLAWSRCWLLLCVSLIASPLWARDAGDQTYEIRLGEDRISVFTYRPLHCEEPGLFLVFHGKGRKASKMRDRARPLANSACLAVIAPLFDEEAFPNWRYHRAGITRKGKPQPRAEWTGTKVEALAEWGRVWLGDSDAPYYLFGHSAGGQFLSRTAAYTPPVNAAQIVIANPSVHVLPSLTETAPYGFDGIMDDDHGAGLLETYLSLPITIYVGSDDTGSKNLVTNAAAMRQGANRFERAVFVYEIASDLAKAKGWSFGWRLVIAKGVGHSSKRMLMAREIEQALGLHLKKTE